MCDGCVAPCQAQPASLRDIQMLLCTEQPLSTSGFYKSCFALFRLSPAFPISPVPTSHCCIPSSLRVLGGCSSAHQPFTEQLLSVFLSFGTDKKCDFCPCCRICTDGGDRGVGIKANPTNFNLWIISGAEFLFLWCFALKCQKDLDAPQMEEKFS